MPSPRPVDLLFPHPRHCRPGGGWIELAGFEPRLSDALGGSEREVLEGQMASVQALAPESPGTPLRLTLAIDQDLAPQAYRLTLAPGGAEIGGGDAAALYYGLVTLGQWLEAHVEDAVADRLRVRSLEVEDSPAFEVRGVMLDVSRNRVPRMDQLEALVPRLAALKINHLQLYTEHTFAYRGHETVWRGWSPVTPEEIRRLDVLCRRHFIELAPNQNSFGHFHRWLIHDGYRDLAECPQGVEHPFSEEREPFSLCPEDPRVLELLAGLYDQLLPNFTSHRFNVGFDETLDLGLGRSRQRCEREGKDRVYLDFLRRVHALIEERGRQMLLWGDIILQHPDRVSELPQDVVALDWGYEADHPFEREAEIFARAGREFWVCPGTSSWNSLLGRTENALRNLESAALAGHRHDARGYLVTDWGDFGHLQPPSVSYLGFLAGAARAWKPDHAEDAICENLARRLFRHEVDTLQEARQLAEAAIELGGLYSETGAPWFNGSPLFFLLLFADRSLEERRFRGLDVDALESIEDRLEATTDLASLGLPGRELRWAASLLAVGAALGTARLRHGAIENLSPLPRQARETLAHRIGESRDQLSELWLQRSREGGLDAALARLSSWRDRVLSS